LILLYHRVAEPQTDPQLLSVSDGRFSDHLDVLRRVATPVSLADVVDLALQNRLPKQAVAITFDDGYADNLLAARPLLERHGVPATVFIATGYLDGRREFWWDALERILLQPRALPQRLELEIEGRPGSWTLADAGDHDEDAFQRRRSWTVLDAHGPSPPPAAGPWSRQALYLDLFDRLAPCTEAARERALDALSAWSGVPRSPRESHRPLTADEVAALAEGGLIEIGAHTVSHARLAAHSESVQRDELTASKHRLESLLAAPVTSFSYPFGTRRDYSENTVRLVREASFARAVSNFRGTVQPHTDVFQLPRILVRDWDADLFEQRLHQEWSRAGA